MLTLLLVVALAGCGLRWQTPDPEPYVPDATEQARQRGAASAVEIGAAADLAAGEGSGAGAGAGGPADGQAVADPSAGTGAVLRRIGTEAAAHADALGGLAPAPPVPEGSPTPSPSPTRTAADPSEVLELLRDGYTTARDDAVEATDEGLARLLASVAAARLVAAQDLALAIGGTAPLSPTDPEALVSTLAGTTDTDTAVTLTQAHDGAAYAFEVLAARSDEALRGLAAARAREHRVLAETWAVSSGISGTPTDPRLPATALPDGILGTPEEAVAAAARIERAVAESYASLSGRLAAAERSGAVDMLALLSSAARGWGGTPPVLPGMADQPTA